MKKGYIYTIVFAFVVSLVFALVLATTNHLLKDKIDQNTDINNKRAILSSLDIEFRDDGDLIENAFDKYIEVVVDYEPETYKYVVDGKVEGYAVRVIGMVFGAQLSGMLEYRLI